MRVIELSNHPGHMLTDAPPPLTPKKNSGPGSPARSWLDLLGAGQCADIERLISHDHEFNAKGRRTSPRPPAPVASAAGNLGHRAD